MLRRERSSSFFEPYLVGGQGVLDLRAARWTGSSWGAFAVPERDRYHVLFISFRGRPPGAGRRWVHLENYIFANAFARLLGEGVGEALSYAIVPGSSYISWDSRRTRVRT